MLVLTRRLGEAIVIRGNIVVTALAIEGNQVSIGIRAPPEVPVDREEIHDRRPQLGRPPRQVESAN